MKARLLFVDDDRLVLSTLSKGLRQMGYDVKTAESAEQAVSLAAYTSFDLAVLDIRLPGMSGLKLADHLRDIHGLSSLFLSAYSEQHLVAEAAYTHGGIGYVVKPVDIPQLVPAVETALARTQDLFALLGYKEQLEHALKGDRQINAAIGILMERHNLDQLAAFDLLRKKARSNRRALADIAAELLTTRGK